MTVRPHDLADPRLFSPRPVRVVDDAVSYLNLRYAVLPGWRPLTLDLHVPVPVPGRRAPVIVYAHGGGFVGGVKEMGPWASLPAKGFAVASIDYRLSGEARYPDPIDDVLAAIAWVRANAGSYGLDMDRIAGWGSSAGGYLMARAALHETAGLSALVLHYPLTDPTGLAAVRTFFGDVDDESLAEAAIAPAVGTAGRIPPMHLSHGDADQRCGLQHSIALHRAVTDAGRVSVLNVVAGADHADPRFATAEVVDPVVTFLQENMCVSQI
ncbi:calcium sensor EFh [Mycolicibacterium litorale]|uniref:Calcium sensor EFh n=1 Tax=Mycolicibacterium litorale TaxID=758802 RepID=A0A6S6PEN6_9MYCO|nr:alpha/beta hydrolase [Mycolicibacterium litorale]BCI55100.1 calcium sensor EFh [Mycolicibacterium litorale]